MEKFTAKIKDPVGLPARPAAITVTIAGRFHSTITIKSNGKKGNLKSIMNIMALGIRKGDEFTVEAEGKDEGKAIAEIKRVMMENNLI